MRIGGGYRTPIPDTLLSQASLEEARKRRHQDAATERLRAGLDAAGIALNAAGGLYGQVSQNRNAAAQRGLVQSESALDRTAATEMEDRRMGNDLTRLASEYGLRGVEGRERDAAAMDRAKLEEQGRSARSAAEIGAQERLAPLMYGNRQTDAEAALEAAMMQNLLSSGTSPDAILSMSPEAKKTALAKTPLLEKLGGYNVNMSPGGLRGQSPYESRENVARAIGALVESGGTPEQALALRQMVDEQFAPGGGLPPSAGPNRGAIANWTHEIGSLFSGGLGKDRPKFLGTPKGDQMAVDEILQYLYGDEQGTGPAPFSPLAQDLLRRILERSDER